MDDTSRLERRGLVLSIVGALGMAALDVVFTREARWVRASTGLEDPPG